MEMASLCWFLNSLGTHWGHFLHKFNDAWHGRVIVKEVEASASHQPNSQGATDANVQAEEGQAKERAWELFTG